MVNQLVFVCHASTGMKTTLLTELGLWRRSAMAWRRARRGARGLEIRTKFCLQSFQSEVPISSYVLLFPDQEVLGEDGLGVLSFVQNVFDNCTFHRLNESVQIDLYSPTDSRSIIP